MTEEEINKIVGSLKEMHPEAKCDLDFADPFTLLVAVMLSAQCTDKRVNEVTDKLFVTYNKPEQYASMKQEDLEKRIFSCGFYKNKAKNIIAMSRRLIDEYGGQVPADFNEMVSLPGVGRKTASVVSTVAFNIPAMPVDTHVFRVSHRLGLSEGKEPSRVEEDLKKEIDRDDWNSFHHCMIYHGRYVCHSRNPECDKCKLTEICGYYKEKKEQ